MRIKQRKKIRKKRLQTRRDRIMTLANAISLSRIFLAIPLVLLFEDISKGESGKLWWAFGLIIIIVLTDFLDGYVARKAEETTNFGKLIDPVADKVCMMVVMIYLIISYKLPFLLFFVTLAIRDVFLIIIGVYLMFSQEEVFQSNRSGKWFMGITALMMTFFLFQDPLGIPVYILWMTYLISMLLFAFSTFEYIRRYMRYFKQLENR
jgi:CDP-diacylglycerol--glycerol-3-phosphate 3-phosphatidyltransferase